MTILSRDQVSNAANVDGMLGASQWTARITRDRNAGEVVSLEWIDGTYRGRAVQREAKTSHRVDVKGRSRYDVAREKAKLEREKARQDGTADARRYHDEHRYDECRHDHYEIYTIGLVVRIDTLTDIDTYLLVPEGETTAHQRKWSIRSRDGFHHCRIGRLRLLVGRLLGRRTGK